MRVVITGGAGMLAGALADGWRRDRPDDEIVLLTRADADLRDAGAASAAITAARPDLLIHTAARVGGIAANIADPAGFLMDNLLIDTSVLTAARAAAVEKLIYIGSSCMYPRDYRQPLVEDDVLAAPLEPTNEGYAISKIAASRFASYVAAQDDVAWRTIVPSNLYGPGDDYAAGRSHLVAAAIAKTHRAVREGLDSVEVWGDGTARREFTYVRDLADWVVGAIDTIADWPDLLNVGAGLDHTVLDIHRIAAEVTGYTGDFELQPDKPAGMHQKLMDSTRAKHWGWNPSTSLRDGMTAAFAAYQEGAR